MKDILATALILALVALLPSSTARAAEEKVELKLRFEEGQRLTLTTTVEQKTTRPGGPRVPELRTTASMTTAFTLKVLGVDDDGTATIEVTIKAIAFKKDRGSWSYEYDSKNPPDEVHRDIAAYAAVVGKTFTMKLTPTGQVTELEGAGAITGAIHNAVPDNFRSIDTHRMITLEPKRRFGEDGLKRTMEAAFGFQPDEPVAVGDSWTRTMTIDYGIPVIAEETYTLAERSDGTAAITREATLQPLEHKAPRHRGHYVVNYEVAGTQTGTLSVDEATGSLFKATITQKLEGEIVVWRGTSNKRSTGISAELAITIETQQEAEDAEDTPKSE